MSAYKNQKKKSHESWLGNHIMKLAGESWQNYL